MGMLRQNSPSGGLSENVIPPSAALSQPFTKNRLQIVGNPLIL